jgi:hypothetical protein
MDDRRITVRLPKQNGVIFVPALGPPVHAGRAILTRKPALDLPTMARGGLTSSLPGVTALRELHASARCCYRSKEGERHENLFDRGSFRHRCRHWLR